MEVVLQPDALNFTGNLKYFRINGSNPIILTIKNNNLVVFEDTYVPDSNNVFNIDVSKIIEDFIDINIPDTAASYYIHSYSDYKNVFTVSIKEETTGITHECSFRAVKGGVDKLDELASEFFKKNFLTWQPQEKIITTKQLEWLTYMAATTGSFMCKAYFEDGTSSEVVLQGNIVDNELYSIPVDFNTINSKFAKTVQGYDVWFQSIDLGKISYTQRYLIRNAESSDNYFLFVNSLGGVESIVFNGEQTSKNAIEFYSGQWEDGEYEYDNDPKTVYKQSTGYIANKRLEAQVDEFINSTKRYYVINGQIRRISLNRASVDKKPDTPNIFDFEFIISDATRYQNLNRDFSDLGEFFFSHELIPPLTDTLASLPTASFDEALCLAVRFPTEDFWRKMSLNALMQNVSANANSHGFVNEDWVEANFYNKTFADLRYVKLDSNNLFLGNNVFDGDVTINGRHFLNGDLYLGGNIFQEGSAYETHAEHIYTTKDFINHREGAISAIAAGSIAGDRILKANAVDNVIYGVTSDAVFRFGHEGGTLVAAMGREDNPLKGLTWYDPETKKAMGSGILVEDLHLANWDLTYSNMGKIKSGSNWYDFELTTFAEGVYPTYKVGESIFKIKAGYADNAGRLGGRIAADYWHKDNLNRSDVDFVARNLTLYGNFSSESYVSGFGGHGYLLDHNTASLTLDNLTVRQTMNIYELIINKIRSGNGSYWFSDGMKYTVDYGSNTSYYRIGQDADGGNMPEPFVQGDIVRCQQWTGKGIKYYTLIVEDILNDATRSYFKAATGSKAGTGVPELGDELVRIGNVLDANRQGAVYITSNDDDSPYIDIIDGIGGDYAYNNSFTLNGGSDAKYYTFPITGEIPETVHLSGSYLLYLDDGTVSPRTTVQFKYSDGSAETVIFISHIRDGKYHLLWGSAHPNPDKTLVEIKGWIADHSSGSENKHSVFDNIKISLIYNSMNSKSVARLGKLDGILSPTFGQLNGYGIHTNGGYFENVKVSGEINVTGGNAATKEYTDSSATSTKDLLASKLGYANYNALMNEAINGNTMIKGGVINTDLVAAKAITANMIDVSGLFVGTGGIRMDASATIDWNQVIGGQDAINNIQIGGRNLYKKSQYISPRANNTIVEKEESADSRNGFKLTGRQGLTCNVRMPNMIDGNGLYTISFWGKSNGSVSFSIDICDRGTGYIYMTTEWEKYEFTINVDNYSEEVYNFLDIEGLGYAHYWFKDFKVEKGNKATDWTPAPEDSIINRNLWADSETVSIDSSRYQTLMETVKVGQQLTISCESIIKNKEDDRMLLYFYTEDGQNHQSTYLYASKKKITVTAEYDYVGIRIYATNGWVGDATATIAKLKVEKGSFATTWSSAYEDYSQRLTRITRDGIYTGELTAQQIIATGVKVGTGGIQLDSTATIAWDKVTGTTAVTSGISNAQTTANSAYDLADTAHDLAAAKTDAWVTQITQNTITTSYIKTKLLTTNRLKAENIDVANLLADSLVAQKIQATNIDASKITTGYLSASRIKTNEITTLGNIIAGSFNLGSGNFSVSSSGYLSAKGALVQGTIQTATSGKRVVISKDNNNIKLHCGSFASDGSITIDDNYQTSYGDAWNTPSIVVEKGSLETRIIPGCLGLFGGQDASIYTEGGAYIKKDLKVNGKINGLKMIKGSFVSNNDGNQFVSVYGLSVCYGAVVGLSSSGSTSAGALGYTWGANGGFWFNRDNAWDNSFTVYYVAFGD